MPDFNSVLGRTEVCAGHEQAQDLIEQLQHAVFESKETKRPAYVHIMLETTRRDPWQLLITVTP